MKRVLEHDEVELVREGALEQSQHMEKLEYA